MTEATQYTPRLKTRYQDEIRTKLNDEFSYENVMQIPGLTKIVVNMGVGDAARDSKVINTRGPHCDYRPEAAAASREEVHR